MKVIGLLISFAVMISCQSNKGISKIEYPNQGSTSKLFLYIPKGYQEKIVTSSEGYEYIYKYKDSSVIYITGETNGGLNYDNIRAQNGSYSKLFQAMGSDNDVVLEGVDKNNLFWRHRSFGNYSVGYLKVFKDTKKFFDSVVDNARKK